MFLFPELYIKGSVDHFEVWSCVFLPVVMLHSVDGGSGVYDRRVTGEWSCRRLAVRRRQVTAIQYAVCISRRCRPAALIAAG